jgi:hypothetical protein
MKMIALMNASYLTRAARTAISKPSPSEMPV